MEIVLLSIFIGRARALLIRVFGRDLSGNNRGIGLYRVLFLPRSFTGYYRVY